MIDFAEEGGKPGRHRDSSSPADQRFLDISGSASPAHEDTEPAIPEALEESGRPRCTVYAHTTGSNPARFANHGSEMLTRGIPALQAGGPG